MKLTNSLSSAIVLFCATTTLAKNVVDFKFSDDDIHNMELELQQKEFQIGKKEADNAIDLNQYTDEVLEKEKRDANADAKNVFNIPKIVEKRDGNANAKNVFNIPKIVEKRDAKNVYNIPTLIEKRDGKNVYTAQLTVDESTLFKRDSKNVFDLNLILDDATLIKRDGKNVFNLDFVIDDDLLTKREAKNVVNIHFILDGEDSTNLGKREAKNVIDISLTLSDDDNLYLSTFNNPKVLGFSLGDEKFTTESAQKNGNDLEIKLKKDHKGCHSKKKIFNLDSLSDIIDTFKEKMVDPIINIKDKFVLPEEFEGEQIDFHDTLFQPAQGDIATAITQRSDLGIFSKYLRDSPELYRKCEIDDASSFNIDTRKQILIFAPTNTAMTNLSLKPWQFPENIDSAKSENEEDEIITRNVNNFVETHVVETDNFEISTDSKTVEFKSFNGKKIVLENMGEQFRVKEKEADEWSDITNFEILENGAIITIDKTLIH